MIRERKMIVAMPMGTSVGKENEINQNKKNGRRREKMSGGGDCAGRLWVEWWQKEDEEQDGGADHPKKWEPPKMKRKKPKIRGERIREPKGEGGRGGAGQFQKPKGENSKKTPEGLNGGLTIPTLGMGGC